MFQRYLHLPLQISRRKLRLRVTSLQYTKINSMMTWMKMKQIDVRMLQETHIAENAVDRKKDFTWYFTCPSEMKMP